MKNRPNFADIHSDVMAGLVVGVIALPLSMALAIASGVAPQYGLYTAIIAGIVTALLGGSMVNISGPTAAFVVILLPIVQQHGLAGLLLSGFIAGMILVGLGLARLGYLVRIVPYPVTIGFTTGIGCVIAILQLKDFMGLPIEQFDSSFVANVMLIAKNLAGFSASELFIGVFTLVSLILLARIKTRIPAYLISLALSSLLAWLLHKGWDGFSIETIGSRFQFETNGVIGHGIPSVLPEFRWPWELFYSNENGSSNFSWEKLNSLLPAAISIAVLGSLESLLCSAASDGMTGKQHQPNDELIGQGIANILSPLFGGIPSAAAISRTAVSIKEGARSPIASITNALFILFSMLLFAPLLSYIPMSSMSALLMIIAWHLAQPKRFIRILKIAPGDDIWVLLICFLFTIFFDMALAVGVGMSLAMILFIRHSINLTSSTQITQHQTNHQNIPDSVILYDINGPLFFGTAQKAMSGLTNTNSSVKVVVLNLSAVNTLDMSAIVMMENIAKQLKDKGITLIVSQLNSRLILKLSKAEIVSVPGELEFCDDIQLSLRRATLLLENKE